VVSRCSRAEQGSTPSGGESARRASGVVTIVGRWRDGQDIVDRGTVWTFAPTAAGEGVTLSFTTKPRSAYALQVWYEAGARLVRSSDGVTIDEPDGSIQAYLLNVHVAISAAATASSAYAANLHSLVMTIPPATAARQITYTTYCSRTSRRRRRHRPERHQWRKRSVGKSASSGTSGTSGSSGASGRRCRSVRA
jgi:hypothetical protein